MNSAVAIHRLHFAFTVTFYYIFPQLTMGLALLIVILRSLAVYKRDELYNAARFWARIFALNFASLTICNAAAAEHRLIVGLCWFIPGMALAVSYSCLVYRDFAEKVA